MNLKTTGLVPRAAIATGFVILFSGLSLTARGGLIRSIWACDVPCESQLSHELITTVHVSYCSVSALSARMISSLSPLCRSKSGRADAVASRSSPGKMARCISSSNPCEKEGPVKAGFTCNVICPSEDNVVRKFTACATTDSEAWSFATQICRDARPPEKAYFAQSQLCIADGQTACD